MQRVQYQRRRFVKGIVRPMTEMQTGFVHPAGAPTDKVTKGMKRREDIIVGDHKSSPYGAVEDRRLADVNETGE